MTDMVPPLNQPTVDIGNNLSSINGSISNPSTGLVGLSVGQQITVQINPQSLSQIGTNILLNMDISLPDINGNMQNINTQVELPQQLKLPPHPVEMQIRITANTPQKLDFKIMSIDGKPTASFVPKISDNRINTSPAPSVTTLMTDVSSVRNHPILPLKAQPLLEQIFLSSKVNFPSVSELVQTLPNYQIKMEISRLQPQPYPQEHPQSAIQPDNSQPTPNVATQQTLSSLSPQPTSANIVPQLPTDIADTLISLLKDTLSTQLPNNVTPNKTQLGLNYQQIPQNISTSSLQQVAGSPSLFATQPNIIEVQNRVLPQLEQTLQTLVGRELPATVVDKGELKILQTPLGEVVPELPLKLETGEKLLLKISELIIPQISKETVSALSPLSNKIIEILKPLQGQIATTDFASLVAKIPADNNKMLSNIVSFLKAAETENLSDWLGKELTDTIRLSGAKGQETLNQLENLILGRKEENSQWRIIEIPFFDNDNLSKIRVAIRKYHQNNGSNHRRAAKPDTARFVVDTSFSALGAFQFDGFSIAKDKRFDLIIRTEKDIPDDLCSHIMQLFRSSLSAVDYAGNIRVNVKEKFIKLCEDEQESTILQHGLYI